MGGAAGSGAVFILFCVMASIPVWGIEKIHVSGFRWGDLVVWLAGAFGALKSDGRKPIAQG